MSDKIDDRYPKTTPWICIKGIKKEFSNDVKVVKDELKRDLQGGAASDDASGVGVVDVQPWNDGRFPSSNSTGSGTQEAANSYLMEPRS